MAVVKEPQPWNQQEGGHFQNWEYMSKLFYLYILLNERGRELNGCNIFHAPMYA